jgi:putative methionine-R-sulfoxide reductase with GAF domain
MSTWTSAVGNIFNAGVNPKYSEYLRSKTKLSNQFSVFVALFLALPYLIITLIFWPPLTFIPLLGIFVPIGVIALNYLDYIFVSRILIAILPMVLVQSYHAYLVSDGEQMIAPLAMLALSFSLLPFLMFDSREKLILIPCAIFCFLGIFTFDFISGWFEMNLDATLIREGWLGLVSIGFALVMGFTQIFFLAFLSKQAEDKGSDLLTKSEEREEQMHASEILLTKNLDEANTTKELERIRNWEAEGLAELMGVLRDNSDHTTVLDKAIGFMVDYTGSSVGGIYLIDDEGSEKMIELAACYAYERKKFLDQKFHVGEGLLGQAYLERKEIYITEVPPEYMKIKSGTGVSTPSALLIIPLLLNDKVEGFIEIASFQPFPENVRVFMAKAATNLSVTINSNRVNEHTRKLLVSTQENAEALQAQEEEMRQNLEELAATQEEMRRRETDRSKLVEDLKAQQQEMQSRDGDREKLLGESERKTKFIHLFQSLAGATNQAISIQHAAQMCIDLVCNDLEWALAHACFLEEGSTTKLIASSVWYVDDEHDFEAFRAATEETTFEAGQGLPGRVMKDNSSVWVKDVTADDNYLRAAAAKKAGLKGAFALPVVVQGHTQAVLEFYSLNEEDPDHDLLEVMDQISYQLSRVFEFKKFEERSETTAHEHRIAIATLESKIEELEASADDNK